MADWQIRHDRIRNLLEQNPDTPIPNPALTEMMVEAARADWFDILHLLHDQNRVNGENFTPGLLFNWINLEDPTLPPILQELNIPDEVKEGAAAMAIDDGHEPTLRALIDLGVNLAQVQPIYAGSLGRFDIDIVSRFPPDFLRQNRRNILETAAVSNNVPVVSLMLQEYGASLHDEVSWLPGVLGHAAREGSFDVLSFIKQNYPDEFYFTDRDKEYTLRGGLDVDMVTFLMRRGIDMTTVPFNMPLVGPAADIKKLLDFRKEFPNSPVIAIHSREEVAAIVAIMKSYMIRRSRYPAFGHGALMKILEYVSNYWFH